jgi:hypothetical protein
MVGIVGKRRVSLTLNVVDVVLVLRGVRQEAAPLNDPDHVILPIPPFDHDPGADLQRQSHFPSALPAAFIGATLTWPC